jgi:hypothetical protein
MTANAFTIKTKTTMTCCITAPVPATGRFGFVGGTVRNRRAVSASCDSPGPGARAGVWVGARPGVRLEPDPRTDTPGHLTVLVSRLTHARGDVATNPCRGFPRGAYPEYAPLRGASPGRVVVRGRPW